ncbi:peptidylprolyl isomerase [Clostridium sp. JN-1]|uniref:peptidylprolyl isomerase n=1 Tax=Clostridium sp. JN-1 TaxID=2483110 RepID=UPI000F0B64C3|nr:peptidylprolyl isomerase [Clostridium sp. JN-1]
MNIKKLISIAAISIFSFSTVGCSMIAKTPEAINKSVVAKVNDEKITRGDLDKSPAMLQVIEQVKQQYGENYAKNDEAQSALKTQRAQALDLMITKKVMEQKAKEMNLMPSDSKLKSEVKTQMDTLKKQQFGGDEAKFQEVLKQQNMSEQTLSNLFYDQIRTQEIYKNLSNSVTKNIKIDDKKVEDYYKANQYKYTEKPDKTHLEHILVKTEDDAKKVKARLDKGEDFAKVAKEVSQDPGSKDKGGDLGFVNYVDSGMDPDFMAAAIKLKSGQVSDPVKTQYGYHIIKCVEKQEYPAKSLSTVKEQIRKELEDEQKQNTFKQKLGEWQKAAKITKYEKNLA